MLFDVIADNFPDRFLSSVATEYVFESVLEQIPQACDLGIDQSVVNGGYLVCTRGFKSNTPTPVVWIIICCGRCILDQCMFGLVTRNVMILIFLGLFMRCFLRRRKNSIEFVDRHLHASCSCN